MEIRLIDINPFSRPGRRLKGVKAIVMHWVGNPGSTAEANRVYFKRLKEQDKKDEKPDRYASSHYIIGLKGEVLQTIPTDEVAYHCGSASYTEEAERFFGDFVSKRNSPNNCTIGIEMCHPDWTGVFNYETEQAAIELVANLCQSYGLTPETGIWRHYDVVGWKSCPKFWVDNEHEFVLFKDRVHESITG